MAEVLNAPAEVYSENAIQRLRSLLLRTGIENFDQVQALTPDASTREYFRIPWSDSTAIAAVYRERVDPETNSFLDISQLFSEAGLPVPSIYGVYPDLGIIVQEDLGDLQLRSLLQNPVQPEGSKYLSEAISLIGGIQKATNRAIESNSISSRLAFDTEKLGWELEFFYNHYFVRLRQLEFHSEEEQGIRRELLEVASRLSNRPRVLCHRDFHASNLMIDRNQRLRIVDYQDARMGPASYDLVSLLLDRCTARPSPAELESRIEEFHSVREELGLEQIDRQEFSSEFVLMTIQRGLKAIGTFSNQSLCGRGATYGPFIDPTIDIVLYALESLGGFPALRGVLARCLAEAENKTSNAFEDHAVTN